MDIFNTTFESVWKDTLKSIRYSLLLKIAGANSGKFECLKPLPNYNSTMECREKRKAMFVELLIEILLAGADASALPSGCSCEQLAGTLCGWADSGFTEIIEAIGAIDSPIDGGTNVVQAFIDVPINVTTANIVLPVGATLLNVLPPVNTTVAPTQYLVIRNISGNSGTVVVNFVAATSTNTHRINYSYTV